MRTRNIHDHIGEKYGRWTVMRYVGTDEKYRRRVLVKCECGTERTVRFSELKYGASTSCGCYSKERAKRDATKHGLCRKTPLYDVWVGMKNRCNNIRSNVYNYYGGRGITICKEWEDNFEVFFNWAIENGYKKGLQLDRENNEKGYSPSNCRFITSKLNNRNKRNNILITYNGNTRILADWCDLFGLKHNVVTRRIERGWPVERIFAPATRSNRITKLI